MFRRAGFVERLRSARLEVVDMGDLSKVAFRPDPQNPKQQNLALVCDVARLVADQISKALGDLAKPIVLGGDCTITIGALAGLIRHVSDLGLIYFDGDVDLNTPAETTSGIFDGMGMAHILGLGAEALTHLGSRYPLMLQENVALFGYNEESGWMDDAEVRRLQQCSLARYPASQIRGDAAAKAKEALKRLEDRMEQILVHFDVDVIDFNDFPAADVPHHHGLSFSEAIDALRVFVSSPKFIGLVITELNGERDPDGRYAERLADAVATALEAGRAHWRERSVA